MIMAFFSSSEEETLKGIKNVYDDNKYLIDTHTAVGYSVYKKYVNKTNDQTKTIIASTASPLKFPKAVCKALGLNTEKDEFELINDLLSISNLNSSAIDKINKEFKKEIWTKEEAFKKLKELF